MTQREPWRVAGLGEILWDLLPEGKQLGGAPANFAWHAQDAGAISEVVSRVGADELGREILHRLTGWGLGRAHVSVDAEHPTGTVGVTLGAGGVPEYVIYEDVAWDHIPWTDGLQSLATRLDAVCFGTLGQRAPVSRHTIRGFLQHTRPDCLRVYDVNLRPTGDAEEIVRASLETANVLKMNDAELPRLAAMLGLSGDDAGLLRALVERYGLRLAALTRGPRGSLLVTPSEESDHPGIQADVVDTIGAGDAFTAAMVMALLGGAGAEEINARANEAAACTCAHPGAIPDRANRGLSGP